MQLGPFEIRYSPMRGGDTVREVDQTEVKPAPPDVPPGTPFFLLKKGLNVLVFPDGHRVLFST